MDDLTGFGINLKDTVAETAMSIVYSGVQAEVDRKVCVKFMKEMSNQAHIERFKREAQVLMELSHRNIAKIFQFGVSERPFYVMEWLEGETLARRLSRGPLGADEFHEVFDQIMNALEYAHGKGIIHRDIKPSNIFLCRDGVNMIPKIIDFGIAKRIDADHDAKLTQTGVSIGSPRYMSPEQCTGAEVGVQADVYSLACVIYEALTGNTLYEGCGELEIMYKSIHEMPQLRGVSDELLNVLLKALAKAPADRTLSIGELRQELSGKIAVSRQGDRKRSVLLTGAALVVAAAIAAGMFAVYDKLSANKSLVQEGSKRIKKPMDEEEFDRFICQIPQRVDRGQGQQVRRDIESNWNRYSLPDHMKNQLARNYLNSVSDDYFKGRPLSADDKKRSVAYYKHLKTHMEKDTGHGYTHHLVAIADWYGSRGEKDRATAIFDKALAMHKDLIYEHYHQDEARYHQLFARVLEGCGDLPAAEIHLRQSLKGWQEQFHDDYSAPGLAARTALAMNLYHQKPSKKDEADRMAKTVLEKTLLLKPFDDSSASKKNLIESKIGLLSGVRHYFEVAHDKPIADEVGRKVTELQSDLEELELSQ